MAHYNLIFQGKIVDGASLEEVKNNVAKLFKADAAKTAALFSGKPIVIKKNLDTDSAKKYLAVLKKAGAIVKAVKVNADIPAVEEEPAKEPKTPPTQSSGGLSAGLASLVNYNDPAVHAQESKPTETSPTVEESITPTASTPEINTLETYSTEDSGLELAPENSGPLSQGSKVVPIEIPDIDHLSMAEAESGSLEEFAQKIEPVELPDISDLSMSEANSGSLEGIEEKPDPFEIPDISDLDMAEPGEAPLSSDSPKSAPVDIPDVSDLSMSEAQEGSLEGLEKKPEPVEIPDISHLDLEKEEKKPTNQGKATFQID